MKIINNLQSLFLLMTVSFFESVSQYLRFIEAKKKISKLLNKKKSNSSSFWVKQSSYLQEKLINNELPLSFTSDKSVAHTMFVNARGNWLKFQLSFLKKIFDENLLQKYIHESIIGLPSLVNIGFFSSHNSIHHLYHLALFSKKSKIKLNDINYVIEFGGGYGNMAKIFKRINPKSTYIILDIKEFCLLQYIYLSSILTKNNVKLISSFDEIENQKINIFYDYEKYLTQLSKIKFDLFIATWSLSETTKKIQDNISNTNFLNSRHLLIAFQKSTNDFKFAERIPDLIKKHKIFYNENTKYIDGNKYIFAST